MSTETLDDDKLQKYFDGELSEGEAEVVRREIEASDEHRARLRSLEKLRELLQVAADDVSSDLESDSLFERVRAGIDGAREEGYDQPFGVVEGGASRHPVEPWKIWTPVAGGLAVAATVLLFVLTGGPAEEGPTAGTEEPTVEEEQGDVEIAETSVTTIEAPQGSEVEEVDFGGNIGTVFAVEGEAGEPIAVVWIDDQPIDGAPQ